MTLAAPAIRCLNLGCGNRFHPAWTNVDFNCTGPGVIACDLRKGLPFADASFDVVYHSHVLEHFASDQAPAFLRECYRVLSAGGTIRVAVPDLEAIARNYLQSLAGALAGDHASAERHRWMMLEMYDQSVREKSGGAMAEYLRNPDACMWEFVLGRLGAQAQELMPAPGAPPAPVAAARRRSIARQIAGCLRHPNRLRELFLQLVLGHEYEILQVGRFRRGGEIHQWMYDRLSLARLLIDAGFVEPGVRGAVDSRIPCWAAYHLDTEPDGTVYKPDSLFMEAVKP